MAIGDIPLPGPVGPRPAQSVQDMLLSQVTPASSPNRAMQIAFDRGLITGEELEASKLARPNAQVRAFTGGQMTPDEFLQSQRIAANQAMMGQPTRIMGALPAAGQTGTGAVSPRVARAQSILAGTADDLASAGARAMGSPLAIGAGLTDDIIMQAAMSSAGMPTPVANASAAGAAGAARPGTVDLSRYGTLGADDFVQAGDKGKSFLSRLKPTVTRGGMLRAAGYAGAGIMGRGIVDNMNIGGEGSNWDNILAGGTAGLGIGAGIGSVVPGIGTGIGAGVGLLVGGALEGLFGDKSNRESRMTEAYDTTTGLIRELGTQFGLNDEYMSNIMLSYEAQARMMLESGDEEGLKALTEQMKVGLADTMLQYRMEQEMEAKQNERMLAIQQQFAPIFSSIIDRSALNSGVAYSQALVAADNLAASNPQLAELVRMNAANSQSSQDALMAAYASQAALGMAGNLEEQWAVAANTQPVGL